MDALIFAQSIFVPKGSELFPVATFHTFLRFDFQLGLDDHDRLS